MATGYDIDSIHYAGSNHQSELAPVAWELYHSASVRGLVAGLQGLPIAYTTYAGDTDAAYELFEVIAREAKRVLKFVEPHLDDFERELQDRFNPDSEEAPIGVGVFVD